MPQNKSYIALDVGEKRIGVAVANTAVRIAVPMDTVEVDGSELATILELVAKSAANTIVIGYPRNQAGEATSQTAAAVDFSQKLTTVLRDEAVTVTFQDESLTSVLAEQRLKSYGAAYTKADIDAHAAALILQDYLEQSV